MTISYDPTKSPGIDPETWKKAIKLGRKPILILCFDNDKELGDAAGVSFISFVDFMPRVGERVVLQDGSVCEVFAISHVVHHVTGVNIYSTTPHVMTFKIER